MPRFIAVVKLSRIAHLDVMGSRERFAIAQGYLERRGIAIGTIFLLGATQHLFVIDAAESPTRNLNRALARAWPGPGERPDLARVVSADPWIRRPELNAPGQEGRVGTPSRTELAAG